MKVFDNFETIYNIGDKVVYCNDKTIYEIYGIIISITRDKNKALYTIREYGQPLNAICNVNAELLSPAPQELLIKAGL